jgi:pectin methylesterase-like acyl-CoA thioesterase
VFENSEIRSLGDSKPNGGDSGGYILQARVPKATDLGFVFLNSKITSAAGINGNTIGDGKTYLARSGGDSSVFDNIAFINCEMGSHIAAVGWASEGVQGQPAATPASPTAASGWREYGSTNTSAAPLDLSTRVGGYELTSGEATVFGDRATIFGAINWNPQP